MNHQLLLFVSRSRHIAIKLYKYEFQNVKGHDI
jgi:hypothetical protein